MKKKILLSFIFVCICVFAFGALGALAYTGTKYGDTPLYYETSNNKVEITGCDYSATTIEIPATIDGKPVTSIGNEAFLYCKSLISITIPNSVTSIGASAFSYCISLADITIPNNVTSIGYSAFRNCSSLTNITIPNGVTSISEGVFSGCSSLTNVAIPNGVTNIGYSAFNDCSGLTNIVIPDSVTVIGNYAFYNCSSIASIIIPNSVTSIGNNAFYNCSKLTSITLGNGIKSIGAKAFGPAYTGPFPYRVSVYISDLASYLNCEYNDLDSNPMCFAEKFYINGKRVTKVDIPSGVKKLPVCAFKACSSLTSVTIPNSVTSIGSYAFSSCSGLTSVTIPNSVTSIGDGAFSGCGGLTSVTIPNSVTSIGYRAFYDCSGLTSVTIPDSVTSIGDSAFSGCSGLTNITIPNSVTSIGVSAFSGCRGLTSVTIPDSITSIDGFAFASCSGLTSITIPNSVTNIGDYAFEYCSGLTNITIPNSVTSIGDYAFWDCSGLTNITIPNSVASISKAAFKNCKNLTSITISDSVTSIGDSAFSGCSGLTNITIPNSVTSIGSYAFSDCIGLTNIAIPNSVAEIERNAFYRCPISVVFYIGTEDEWEETYIASDNDTLKQADIVFNAVKKTYRFVTNCESVLPDITDYAVISSPTVKNSGKTLTGWYANEGLSGNSVTFPYYGNATTLYAAWTDRTGTSFDDAFEAEANQQYTVTATDSEQMIYYEFTPKLTGEYRFYTKGNIDTYGYLYDSEKRRLTTNDDGGENSNFKIVYNLTAGEKYYIAIKCYSDGGTFTFVTETDCFEGTKTVCVTASNGESVFVTIPNYLPQNVQIILACYEKGKLTEILSSPNKDETIYFVVSEKFDSAKVMVWESLNNMKPICGAEIVK